MRTSSMGRVNTSCKELGVIPTTKGIGAQQNDNKEEGKTGIQICFVTPRREITKRESERLENKGRNRER